MFIRTQTSFSPAFPDVGKEFTDFSDDAAQKEDEDGNLDPAEGDTGGRHADVAVEQ